MRRSLGWVLLVAVAVGALAVAVLGHRDEPTNAERALDIAGRLACPVCEGQSAADSNVAAAQAIRSDIRRRIDQGQTDDEIIDGVLAAYPVDLTLTPKADGVVGLVWIAPVVALVTALAGLVVVFRRWSTQTPAHASLDDRRLVDAALTSRHTAAPLDPTPDDEP